MVPNISDYMYNPFASHVLRDLFKILSGITYLSVDSRKRKYQQKKQQKINYDINTFTHEKTWKSFRHLLRDITTQLINLLSEEKETQYKKEIVYDETMSLCLQVLITSLAQHDKTHENLLKPLIQHILCLFNNDDKVNKSDYIHIQRMMKHSSASRLIENILPYLTEEQLYMINETIMLNNYKDLAQHNIGNFTLQSYMIQIADLKNSKKIEKLIKKYIKFTLKHCKQFLYGNRGGMITQLIQLSAQSQIKQDKIYKKLNEILIKENEKNMVSILLSLPNKSIKEQYAKYSMLGSQIILHLCNFQQDHISHDFLALDDDKLLDIALDFAGSRAIDGYYDSKTISDIKKQNMSYKLEKYCIKLAQNGTGSYILEKIFNCGNINTKFYIAQQFIDNMSKLLGSFTGKILLRKFEIDEFKRNRVQWQRKIEKQLNYEHNTDNNDRKTKKRKKN